MQTCTCISKRCQARQLRPYIGFVSPSMKAMKEDSMADKVEAIVASNGLQPDTKFATSVQEAKKEWQC